MMTGVFEAVDAAARAVRARIGDIPETAIVLGTGLGGFADRLSGAVGVSYDDLHWPPARVEGHAGRLVVGHIGGRTVAVLAGRVHAYEGYDLQTVVFGVRVMGRAGVRRFILTNAAGGVNPVFTPGTLMVIDDHINLLGASPLAGPNDERLGPRFPDMSEVYDRRLRAVADDAARGAGVTVVHGVYAAMPGPSYETPAEIRALRTLGADAVGMSTVPEAIAARHMGLDVLGLSCITNTAAGAQRRPLSHAEVVETAARTGEAMAALLEGILAAL